MCSMASMTMVSAVVSSSHGLDWSGEVYNKALTTAAARYGRVPGFFLASSSAPATYTFQVWAYSRPANPAATDTLNPLNLPW